MNPFKQAAVVRQAIVGVIKRTGNQALQVLGLSGELIDDVPLYQQAGFASWLPKDAEVIMFPMSGKARNFVIVGSRDAVAIEVLDGETLVYNQHGVELRLCKDKVKTNVDIYTDGDIHAAGDIYDRTSSMQLMRQTYNQHNHSAEGTSPPSVLMIPIDLGVDDV
ncbi:phage baseplate assembly protein domain-containing protein [Psychrobacter pygoscelis]|uniref:phage baseplate assembly protein domain-containing protein n=1 Tax=Psychrobacter pygoscelis TaxID=2488563 RepID=UPI0010390D3E|nr:phage baseplate assembly protein [Psychrobacter pygoscelis]